MTAFLPNINKGAKQYTYSAWESFLYSTAVPYASNPILNPTAPYNNTCPAGIMQDPLDATKKIFWRANFQGGSSVSGRISLFVGSDINDPYSLGTEYGVVLQGSESYDTLGCRFGWPVFMGGTTIWYYYVGVDASHLWRICRAVSTDGGRTYTKMGVAMAFNGADEGSVSGPSIFIEGGVWYMCYTAWTGSPIVGPVFDPGNSTAGIKLATSTDGITWTQTGTFLVANAGRFFRVEDATFYKVQGKYILIYSAYSFPADEWGLYLASSNSPSTPFLLQKPILFTPGDVFAVGFLFDYPDGFTYLYYQFESSPAIDPVYVAKIIPHSLT